MFRTYVVRLIIFTAALAVIVAIANYVFPWMESFIVFSWVSLFFFFILTLITFYIGLRGMEKSGHGFVASVNGIVLIKLLLSVALIIVYLLLVHPSNAWFIAPFFFFYIAFNVFEIRQFLIAQRQKSRDKSTTPS